MNKRNLSILGLLTIIGLVMGSIGFVIADNVNGVPERTCDGSGLSGLMKGRGFWAQLSEEQQTVLAEKTQEMLEAGATHEEIREMKATMLLEWGIEAPQWSGPHFGEQDGGYGHQSRDGSRSGRQFGGQGNGGKGYNGNCPKTN